MSTDAPSAPTPVAAAEQVTPTQRSAPADDRADDRTDHRTVVAQRAPEPRSEPARSEPVGASLATRVPLPAKVVRSVRGEIDGARSRAVAHAVEELAEQGARSVVLDLSGVPSVDPLLPRLLLQQHWQLQSSGGGLSVEGARPGVGRVFAWSAARHLLR